MTYPDYDTYQKLYGRYLKKGPEKFFAKRDPKGLRILDLCAGGGQLTQYALAQGATYVEMVDESARMLNPEFDGKGKVGMLCQRVESYLDSVFHDIPFDLIVCRQAVNYWLKNVGGDLIAHKLKVGGSFVFNTFGNKPSTTPSVREYYHEGKAYKEISYLIGDKIHHVQTASGIPPHVTLFDWIERDEYVRKLEPYFTLTEEVDGPSSMWYCIRK